MYLCFDLLQDNRVITLTSLLDLGVSRISADKTAECETLDTNL